MRVDMKALVAAGLFVTLPAAAYFAGKVVGPPDAPARNGDAATSRATSSPSSSGAIQLDSGTAPGGTGESAAVPGGDGADDGQQGQPNQGEARTERPDATGGPTSGSTASSQPQEPSSPSRSSSDTPTSGETSEEPTTSTPTPTTSTSPDDGSSETLNGTG